jgi:hypothetical protein
MLAEGLMFVSRRSAATQVFVGQQQLLGIRGTAVALLGLAS